MLSCHLLACRHIPSACLLPIRLPPHACLPSYHLLACRFLACRLPPWCSDCCTFATGSHMLQRLPLRSLLHAFPLLSATYPWPPAAAHHRCPPPLPSATAQRRCSPLLLTAIAYHRSPPLLPPPSPTVASLLPLPIAAHRCPLSLPAPTAAPQHFRRGGLLWARFVALFKNGGRQRPHRVRSGSKGRGAPTVPLEVRTRTCPSLVRTRADAALGSHCSGVSLRSPLSSLCVATSLSAADFRSHRHPLTTHSIAPALYAVRSAIRRSYCCKSLG